MMMMMRMTPAAKPDANCQQVGLRLPSDSVWCSPLHNDMTSTMVVMVMMAMVVMRMTPAAKPDANRYWVPDCQQTLCVSFSIV